MKVIALLFAFAFTSLPVMAELERGACRDIVKKTCGDKKGDREAFHACMKENKDKFPAECKERFEAMKEKRKEK